MSTPGRESAGRTLPLFALPYTFSQVGLLSQRAFREQAAEWGHRLSDGELEAFHELGLLVPFFVRRPEPGPACKTDEGDHTPEAALAREGYLDDPGAAAYEKAGGCDRLYSHWQLLGLRTATAARSNIKIDPGMLDNARAAALRERRSHVALAALSGRFFAQIVGRWTAPIGADFPDLWRTSHDLDARRRLETAGAQAGHLRDDAEWLLTLAHSDDPLGSWWRVVRYSNHEGWFSLKGTALQCIWYRIAAEVLLRAHEELANAGSLEPLPSVAGASFWAPLMDRVGEPDGGLSLDQALTQMSVSPHPPVVLVVEGETEEHHVHELLDLIGARRQVRVVNQQTSGDTPHRLARFLAPQIRGAGRNWQSLERNPTALYVAMDPENAWAADKFPETVRKLRGHMRAEVRHQGGIIEDDELDELLNVRTWGDHTYELANFTDDELTDALIVIAPASAARDGGLRVSVAQHVTYAREHHCDFKVVFQRLGWNEMKMPLARQITPTLISKIDAAEAPPVIHLVRDVLNASVRLSVGTIYLKGQGTQSAG